MEILVNKKWMNLSKFEVYSKKYDKSRRYNYFKEFILLLSDLCLGRNLKAIKPLQEIYPFYDCYIVIENENYSIGLRQSFLKLIITLHLDDVNFQQILIPNKFRFWGDYEKNDY